MSDFMECSYRLDKNDRIIDVGGNWDEFALANGGPDAVASAVLGTSLWSSISGDSPTMFTRAILQHARLSDEPVSVSYYCNSAKIMRRVNMILDASSNGEVQTLHRIVESRYIGQRSSMTPRKAKTSLIKGCAKCKSIRVDGEWKLMDSIDLTEHDRIFFGLCERCKLAV